MHNEIFTTTKEIKNITIALFSDLHFYPEIKKSILDKITTQIKIRKPDYIAITGDILDSSDITNIEVLKTFLIELSKISKIIVVLGNHDEKKGKMGKWSYEKNNALVDFLNTQNNIYLLNDNTYIDNDKNICFYGFNLSYHYYEVKDEEYNTFTKEVNELHTELNPNTYNITLFHSPINIYKFIKENNNHNLSKSDLILSGHMHNGALPFIITHPLNKLFKTSRSLMSPLKTLFPKYAQGRIYKEKADGYVYEGITKLSNSTRLLHKLDCLFQKNVEFITIKKDS